MRWANHVRRWAKAKSRYKEYSWAGERQGKLLWTAKIMPKASKFVSRFLSLVLLKGLKSCQDHSNFHITADKMIFIDIRWYFQQARTAPTCPNSRPFFSNPHKTSSQNPHPFGKLQSLAHQAMAALQERGHQLLVALLGDQAQTIPDLQPYFWMVKGLQWSYSNALKS